MGSSFSSVNAYTNEHAWRSFIVVLISFILFWIAVVASDLFGGLLRGRSTTTTRHTGDPLATNSNNPAAVYTQSRSHRRLERVRDALLYIFLSLATVTFLNYHVNGIYKGFEVLAWIVLVVGVIWAIARGLVKRFAVGLLILIIPLYLAMYIVGLRRARYVAGTAV